MTSYLPHYFSACNANSYILMTDGSFLCYRSRDGLFTPREVSLQRFVFVPIVLGFGYSHVIVRFFFLHF